MAHTEADTKSRRIRAGKQARAASGAMVVLLLIQYVLGLSYNLYGTAPTAAHQLQMFSGPLVATHSIVGMLLVLGAIYVLVVSIRAKEVRPVIASAVGIASIIGAFASGTAFLQTGANAASLTMGVLLAVAVLSYATGAWSFTRKE